MISVPGSSVIRTWPKAPTGRAGLKHTYRVLAGPRFVVLIAFSISLGLAVALVGPSLRAHQTAEPSPDCPATQTRINLVFIIDRSGSLAHKINPPHEQNEGRGQTYNVEIEGVRRALLDSSVIPRDGSVSVGAVLFDGEASVALSLTAPINSDGAAQAIAAQVETLHCLDLDSDIASCPAGDTNFDKAIRQADQIARSRSGARRVFIMSTDGEATDLDKGVSASNSARENASKEGVKAELDVILIGVPAEKLNESQEAVNKVVFPSPPTDLPGAVEIITKRNDCNGSGAPFESLFEEGCQCEIRQFADFTRRALRSDVPSSNLTVTTSFDPIPSTPFLEGTPLSLRQAIEMANSNGGHTAITFNLSSEDKILKPNVPLPPLTAPDITICGCAADCAPSIPDKVSCSQASLREEKRCQPTVTIDGQGKLQDGILIRSNRDVVRGLQIINFVHAGIVIQPVCPSDNTGFNRIELNKLEDNTKAGICVLDPPPGHGNAVTHNIGNTISMNDISGSETPIDLGSAAPFPPSAPMSVCDGPTPNDIGDGDEGPNTLLNYPAPFTADTAGNTVTVTGRVNIPAVDHPINEQAVVEVFAVTKVHPASGAAVVDAVTFFGRIFLDEMEGGAFSMRFTDVPVSPINGYTAAFTDRAGNTSELIPVCSGP
ncbi:MAG TPA: vWA domain-containing protein, partial [Blastocatellia bacterium]|nr:vWA domain-containing protein [Blastocatellia bacterium]